MKRRPVATFVFLACAFSWPLWIGAILSSRGLLPFRVPSTPLGSFGPALAAIVMARLVGEGPTTRRMRDALTRFRAWPRVYVVVFALAPLLYAVACFSAVAFSGERPTLQNLDRWYLVFPIALGILVLGGPLGEEIGWRGWLLPRLLETTSPLRASLVVATCWFIWHLPLFFMEGASQKGTSIAGFGVAVLAMSFLFTWLYLETEGSLLLAILFHLAINLSGFCLGLVAPSLDASPVQGRVFLALLVLSAAVAAGAIAKRGKAVRGVALVGV